MTKKVAIIGAGLTGVTCAKMLHAYNVDFSLFESSDQVGGRVKTDYIDGFKVDAGFQVLLDSYPAIKRHLDLDKLELCAFDSGALIGSVSNCIAHPIKNPKHLLSTFLSPSFNTVDKAILLRLITQSYFNYKLGNQNDTSEDCATLDFLINQGFSERSINDFFRTFFGGVFLDESLKTSSRMFDFTFNHFLKGTATIPKLGMQQIPILLAKDIPRDNLHLNCAIKSISKNGAQFNVVDPSGNNLTVNKVIVATDSISAVSLFNNFELPKSLQNIINRSIPFKHTFCLHFAAPTAPYHNKMIFLETAKNSPILHMCPISNIAASYTPDSRSLISVTSLMPTSSSLESVKHEVIQQLLNLFGQQVATWECIDCRLIKYALPNSLSGSLTPWHRTTALEDGIYIGGDYTETPSINGAIEAGEAIANSIINSLAN